VAGIASFGGSILGLTDAGGHFLALAASFLAAFSQEETAWGASASADTISADALLPGVRVAGPGTAAIAAAHSAHATASRMVVVPGGRIRRKISRAGNGRVIFHRCGYPAGMRSTRPGPAASAALDIGCVLAFVIIGRASHEKGETLAGIASTSWPFLAGLAIGWLASRAWRRPGVLAPAGVSAWLCTVAFGMAARVVSGQGTAFAFILVALAFLGLFLLGWRALWLLTGRFTARRGQPSRS